MRDHYTSPYGVDAQGVWYRVDAEVNQVWYQLRRQQSAIALAFLREHVQGWRAAPVGSMMPVITLAIRDDKPEVGGWLVEHGGADPVPAVIAPEDPDRTVDLGAAWPTEDLATALVTVVGVGSIGSHASEALAAYGVHRIALVDPDRLLPHNLVRHRSPRKWVGRPKVQAVRDVLLERFPYLDILTYPHSVVDGADLMRPLFAASAVVLCCSDGVESRLVTSHLAFGSDVSVVLTCVLGEGAFGEVIRLRPGPRVGCLDCQRRRMREAGQMDPEPIVDMPYGTGTHHRAMTAVGGDLQLVGDLGAKVSVATILESSGHPDQRLPGDHAIVSLRPEPGWAPPFDLDRAGQIRWLPVSRPVDGCPTCSRL